MSSHYPSIHTTFRTRRTRETESRPVIVRGQGSEKGGINCKEAGSTFCGGENVLYLNVMTQFCTCIRNHLAVYFN